MTVLGGRALNPEVHAARIRSAHQSQQKALIRHDPVRILGKLPVIKGAQVYVSLQHMLGTGPIAGCVRQREHSCTEGTAITDLPAVADCCTDLQALRHLLES